MREENAEPWNADKPGKCEEEAEVSPDKEKKEDKGGKEEGASIDAPLRPFDFPNPRLPDRH